MKRETMMFRSTLRRPDQEFSVTGIGVLGIDLFSVDIEFFSGFVDRDIGQHEDFMGGKDPEVLAHKNDELVAVKDFEFTAVHLPGGVKEKGSDL